MSSLIGSFVIAKNENPVLGKIGFYQNAIGLVKEIDLVRNQNDGLLLQRALDAILEDSRPRVRIHGAEDVVQEVDVAVLVHGAGELNALFLTAAEIQPALADLRLIALLEQLHVALQRADAQGLVVASSVHRLPEQNVLFDRPALNPRALGYIRRASCYTNLGTNAQYHYTLPNKIDCSTDEMHKLAMN